LVPARLGGWVDGFLVMVPVAFVLVFLALLAGYLSVPVQSPGRSWPLLASGVVFTAAALPLTLALVDWGRADGEKANGEKGKDRTGMALAAAFAAAGLLSLALIFAAKGGALSMTSALNLLAGLSADGRRLRLGTDFWLMHLPFLPPLAFLASVAAGLAGKGAALVLGGMAPEKPLLAAGLYALAIGLMLAAAAFAVATGST